MPNKKQDNADAEAQAQQEEEQKQPPADAGETKTSWMDTTQPGYQPETPPVSEEQRKASQATNTPNPALVGEVDVGTLQQPKNTGTGDTPAPGTPGSAPGPEDKYKVVETLPTNPYPKGGEQPSQSDLPPTPDEAG